MKVKQIHINRNEPVVLIFSDIEGGTSDKIEAIGHMIEYTLMNDLGGYFHDVDEKFAEKVKENEEQ